MPRRKSAKVDPSSRGIRWLTPLWAVLAVAIVLVGVTFLGAIVAGFTWPKVARLFEAFGGIYVIILVFIYILFLSFLNFTMEFAFYSLMTLGVALIIASQKGNSITDRIRAYIDANFDLNYFMGGFAMFGIILALIPIWQDGKKKRK